MNETTKRDYQRRYERLLEEQGIDPAKATARAVARALKTKAESGMSKGYWRTLKTACIHMTKELGYPKEAEKLGELANWPKGVDEVKRGFKKSITSAQADRLVSCASSPAVKGAIELCRLTGMRPEEIAGATYRDGVISIVGAKKTEDGMRGADREIVVSPEFRDVIENSLEAAQTKTKDELRHGVSRAAAKAFPTMKVKPSLKTFRHQLCSEFKALIKSGEMEAKEASYMLGHQSADSINKYGNVRSAKGSPIAIDPAAAVDSVRTPSGDLQDAMDRLTPADRMASSNDFEAGRKKVESEKPQNTKENRVARHKPDWGSLDL